MTLRILIALALGIAVGLYTGPIDYPIELVGKSIIDLIKVLAIPMVVFAILETMVGISYTGRDFSRLLSVAGLNAVLAATIGLFLSNHFQPGVPIYESGMTRDLAVPENLTKVTPERILETFLPKSILSPFVENQMMGAVVIALLLGFAIRSVQRERGDISSTRLVEGLGFMNQVFVKTLQWVIQLIPVAVFAVVVKTIGEHGLEAFGSLWKYVAVAIGGLLLHAAVVYPLWVIWSRRVALSDYFKQAFTPCLQAFGVNSSLAALPTTLLSLERLGISKHSSRLGAIVGTNLNNDGILLYECMAVIVVTQAFGMSLSLGSQLMIIGVCIVTALGTAGIPEAGIVALSLVLAAFKLPIEILPVLLSVDWIIARVRSVVNVMSDITVPIALDGIAARYPRHQEGEASG